MKKRNRKTDDNGKKVTKLLVAMTGKASAAKAAEGDKTVFDYIASLPQPQRGIAEHIDGLAAKTLPNLQRAVKWGDGVLRSGRRLVLFVRRFRRPFETDVHTRRGDQA